MGFLSLPAALFAAAIFIPLLVALYFLKLRRKRVAVSSTLLWKKAIQDMQVNAPFQRLRKSLLLMLQLLILLALLVAFARPTFDQSAKPGQRMVILIDRSASMNATDVSPTRFAEAKRLAIELVDGMASSGSSENGGAMVIAFGQRAQIVQPFTNDPSLLRNAIKALQPSDESSHIEPALQLIQRDAAESVAASEQPLVVYILSDGRLSDLDKLKLAGAEIRYTPIGGTAGAVPGVNNVGIVSLAARRDLKRPELVHVFARFANYGTSNTSIQVTLRVDGNVVRVSDTSVPSLTAGTASGMAAGEPGSQSMQFDFDLAGSALVEISHDHSDQLLADNVARLTVAPPKRLRVLMVSEGNRFLERAIRVQGVKSLRIMRPTDFEAQNPSALRRGSWEGSTEVEGFDALVFDHYTPKEVPRVDSLYLGSVPPIPGLKLLPPRDSDQPTQHILSWEKDHPLLRYVALDDLVLADVGRLSLPDTAEVLAMVQSGPVMAEMNVDGVHHVVTAFDLIHTNWPMQVSFPVFISNAVPWLGLGGQIETGLSYQVGEVAIVPVPGGQRSVIYSGPLQLRASVSDSRAVLPIFERVGLYTAENPMEKPWDKLPVNLTDAAESDIRTVDKLDIGGRTVQGEAASTMARREVWPWFVWAALAVLVVEWIVYTRRMYL